MEQLTAPTAYVPGRRYTVEEYFQIDEASDVKLEFRDGEIFPAGGTDALGMAGGGFVHMQIGCNLIRELGVRLKGTPCQPLNSDLRVSALKHRRYCYPDTGVVCGTPQFDPPDRQVTLVNPRVVFEVLSPSTEADDRGEKFTFYRQAESLQEYFLVSQDRPMVEPYYQRPDGGWMIGQAIIGLDASVPVQSLGIELPMAEIYDRVTFPSPPEV